MKMFDDDESVKRLEAFTDEMSARVTMLEEVILTNLPPDHEAVKEVILRQQGREEKRRQIAERLAEYRDRLKT